METSAKSGLNKNNNKLDWFMETSAKSGLNVNELFCEIGKRLYKETEKQNKIDKVRKFFFLNSYF